jgi:hypothetical protein
MQSLPHALEAAFIKLRPPLLALAPHADEWSHDNADISNVFGATQKARGLVMPTLGATPAGAGFK